MSLLGEDGITYRQLNKLLRPVMSAPRPQKVGHAEAQIARAQERADRIDAELRAMDEQADGLRADPTSLKVRRISPRA